MLNHLSFGCSFLVFPICVFFNSPHETTKCTHKQAQTHHAQKHAEGVTVVHAGFEDRFVHPLKSSIKVFPSVFAENSDFHATDKLTHTKNYFFPNFNDQWVWVWVGWLEPCDQWNVTNITYLYNSNSCLLLTVPEDSMEKCVCIHILTSCSQYCHRYKL